MSSFGNKVSITNVDDAETVFLTYNPEDLEVNMNVKYANIQVPGMSHEVLQYANTGNVSLRNFKFKEFLAPTETDPMATTAFLTSLCYPLLGAGSVRAGAPPRALIVWPNLLSLTCVVKSFKVHYIHLYGNNTPKEVEYELEFEEVRDVRWTRADAILSGFRRSLNSGEDDAS